MVTSDRFPEPEPSAVERVLNEITEAVRFCTTFCAVGSKPVKVLVVVTCDDGLSHEYERDIDDTGC